MCHIAIYPVGSVVKLNNGEIGIVIHVSAGLQTRPIVRLIIDAGNHLYDTPRELDLSIELTVFIDKVLDETEIAAVSSLVGTMELFRHSDAG